MPISNKLSITDLEFDNIKSNLKTFLRSQSEFQDYDFEGSGLSVLIDLLAYNTHYMGYYANMLGNEMFLDSSALRESVLSHAKHLNFIPFSMRSPKAYLNFTFTPSGSPTSLTILKNTRFTTSIDGIKYTFATTKTTSVPRSATSTYTVSNVEIVEGKILNRSYTVSSADKTQRFIIPNPKVDTNSISVVVQTSSSDSTVNTFTNASSLDVNTIKGSDKVFFLEEIEDQRYELIFGDGSIGKSLEDGNIIFIEYMVCNGEQANKASSFLAIGTVAGLSSSDYVITTSENSIGGTPIQTSESIRFQAPKLYAAQKRATTKADYKSIILNERPDIESITVYGGEDADPVQYGKVFIAAKPTGNNTFSTATKEIIKESILKKVNVVTVTPEMVDPVFFYLLIDSSVNYDPVVLLTDTVTLQTNINTSIQTYLQKNLEKFDQKFRYSQLVQSIDNTDVSIRNNKTAIKYQQRITPATLDTPTTYTMYFNNQVTTGSITTTSFTGTDGNTYSLVDDKSGSIKAAKTTSGVVDSPKSYLIQSDGTSNQGTIDYATGKVILNSFRPLAITDGTTNIKLTVTPEINNSDITPLREQILTYDVTDTESISINMVAETIV
jgi:hypothetical protein